MGRDRRRTPRRKPSRASACSERLGKGKSRQSPGPLGRRQWKKGRGCIRRTEASRCKANAGCSGGVPVLHRGHAARFIVKRVEKPTDNKTT
jgi:hypothetical protein